MFVVVSRSDGLSCLYLTMDICKNRLLQDVILGTHNYVTMEMKLLREALKKAQSCKHGELDVVEDVIERQGLCASLYFICMTCKRVTPFSCSAWDEASSDYKINTELKEKLDEGAYKMLNKVWGTKQDTAMKYDVKDLERLQETVYANKDTLNSFDFKGLAPGHLYTAKANSLSLSEKRDSTEQTAAGEKSPSSSHKALFHSFMKHTDLKLDALKHNQNNVSYSEPVGINENIVSSSYFEVQMEVEDYQSSKNVVDDCAAESRMDSDILIDATPCGSENQCMEGSTGRNGDVLVIEVAEREESNLNLQFPFVCIQCCMIMCNEKHLTRHMNKYHARKGNFECKICEKAFFNKNLFYSHRCILKTGTVLCFKCKHCINTFDTYKSIIDHRKEKHMIPQNISQAEANKAEEYIKDVYKRVRKYPFLCPFCFKTVTRITTHIYSHLGVKPFICSVCGTGMQTKGKLNVHFQRYHTEGKQYLCSQCGMEFKTSIDLYKHGKRHAGTLKITCSYCGKMFSEKKTLKVHERLHTGENPYLCQHCGKGYPQNIQLRLHLKNCRGLCSSVHSSSGSSFSCDNQIQEYSSQGSAMNPLPNMYMGQSAKYLGQNATIYVC